MFLTHDISFTSEKPSAIALGAFDGVHIGHRAVIKAAVDAASSEGLVPAVFTFSDLPKTGGADSARAWPLCTFAQKAALIEGLGVELLVAPPFDESVRTLPAERFVREILLGRLSARHIVCGYDHRFGEGGKGNAELLMRICREYGAAVTVIPPVTRCGRRVSSTDIRRLIESGRIDDARALLGHEI